MIQQLIDTILDFLLGVFVEPRVVVVLIAVLPIVEARMAIPIALGYDLGFFQSWLFSFVGSSLMAPLLLAVLIPFIRWLGRTRLFRKLGNYLYEKFDKKSAALKDDGVADGAQKKRDLKKMLALFCFVAIPLPMTGVWTGCAVASIIGLKYWKSLIAVVTGNLVASLLILLLCALFQPYMDYIILALGLIAIAVVIALIVKVIAHKPTPPQDDEKKED